MGAQMEGAILSDTQMEGADLKYAQMEGANLTDAQMEEADLWRAQMERANLRGALMEGADLREAQMEGAVLRGAQMDGADLSRAQMEGADLRDAQMRSVKWAGASIGASQVHAADLTGAIGLTQDQLASVIGNTDTKLPPGLYVWSCWDADAPPPVTRKITRALGKATRLDRRRHPRAGLDLPPRHQARKNLLPVNSSLHPGAPAGTKTPPDPCQPRKIAPARSLYGCFTGPLRLLYADLYP